MIQTQNLKILKNIPFEEYLTLPGFSHSTLRNHGKPPIVTTAKMMLGKDVDNYLTDPTQYNHSNANVVRPIAVMIKKKIGVLYRHLEPQLAFTCEFVFGGFVMLYKGRADLAIRERLVIDTKISKMPLMKGVDFFGYDNQLSGYALALRARAAIIISQHPEKMDQTSFYNVPLKTDWWEQMIIRFGEPIL